MLRGLCIAVAAFATLQLPAPAPTLPLGDGSFHFAVIGDSGTGGRKQYQIADLMLDARTKVPYDMVLMLGDNLYDGDTPRAYQQNFELPYRRLLNDGVKFYASLGNHDDPKQRLYRPFNMNGERYYTFKSGRQSVRFFALDSTSMSPDQLKWVEKELSQSRERWKICFFHYPLYSSGARHGSDLDLRASLEPLFVKYGVNVVFSGHEHFYERLKPQKGISYFISGAAAKLRKGNIKASDLTAKGYDEDNSFMLVEIQGDTLHYQTISRNGQTVDSGSIRHPRAATTEEDSLVDSTSWLPRPALVTTH